MKETRLTVGSLIPKTTFIVQEPKPKVIPNKQPKNYETIRLLQNHLVYNIRAIKGKLLLDTALQQGQQLNYKCRNGTCGKCTVKVEEGGSLLCPATQKEHKKLKNAINTSYRLACQATIK